MTSSPPKIHLPLRVLGLESSCDDTAAARVVFHDLHDFSKTEITHQAVFNQNDLHAQFGGVVPEIAARAHAERLDPALHQAGIEPNDFDIIAVTTGPGLIGGLHAARAFACALGTITGKPLIGVNHLAGHALTPVLTDNLSPPFLMLLVSGGHCQLLLIENYGQFTRLGTTIDDSPGEAFDKLAKMLGLGYPGGPAIEACAQKGDSRRFTLPKPLIHRKDGDFSFSGLKTAVRRVRDQITDEKGGMTAQDRADLCASFQQAVADTLAQKSRYAVEIFRDRYPNQPCSFAISGGVSANQTIRQALGEMLGEYGAKLIAPPIHLCTDNAAMIAFAGGLKYILGMDRPEDLQPRSRWPLDATHPSHFGAGKRGPKA